MGAELDHGGVDGVEVVGAAASGDGKFELGDVARRAGEAARGHLGGANKGFAHSRNKNMYLEPRSVTGIRGDF